jgi:cystathionine beta-synthase
MLAGMSSRDGILPNILGAIGETPLVRLNNVGSEYDVEILAKCEFLNPGGSVKERVAYRMIEEAEKSGRIKPGDTLIEATSGNTGIGLAMAAAVKGYRLIITMPEKMSKEKQLTMEALGAEIVRTRTEAAHEDADSNFNVAAKLQREIPNAHILDQWTNPGNPDAHYFGTAEEIYRQTGGKFDYFVAGAGTGGTLTGVGRFMREKLPHAKVIGVDPEGSIIGGGEPGPTYLVEGIGYDFVPDTMDLSVVDEWVKTNDKESFHLARRLIREEGMLVGGSSGSAMMGALHVAAKAHSGARIVVVLPDNIRNYMSKFLDPAWLREKGMMQ